MADRDNLLQQSQPNTFSAKKEAGDVKIKKKKIEGGGGEQQQWNQEAVDDVKKASSASISATDVRTPAARSPQLLGSPKCFA